MFNGNSIVSVIPSENKKIVYLQFSPCMKSYALNNDSDITYCVDDNDHLVEVVFKGSVNNQDEKRILDELSLMSEVIFSDTSKKVLHNFFVKNLSDAWNEKEIGFYSLTSCADDIVSI